VARRRRPEPPGTATATATAEDAPPVVLVETWAEDWLTPADYTAPGRAASTSATATAEPQAWAWSGIAAAVMARQSRARGDWAHAHGLTWTQMSRRHPRQWHGPRWRSAPPHIDVPEPARPAAVSRPAPQPPAPQPRPSRPSRPVAARPRVAEPLAARNGRGHGAYGWHETDGWSGG
jgi:hypothetical protein